MALLLSASNVVCEFPTKRVFDGISLGVNTGDMIGVVGNNGDGKSTLIGLLSGRITPNSGEVLTNKAPTIGYLGQTDELADDDTVSLVLEHARAEMWQRDRASREIVAALIADIPLEAQVGTLSGGQRRRVDIARLLLGDWDVLMLDEPTNHLDIVAINWLAQHLKHRWPKGDGALIAVTHDRWFLDEVSNLTWEVHDARVSVYEGGYAAYTLARLERARLERVRIQKHNNELRRELAWLSRGAQARRSKPKFHIEAAHALIEDVPALRQELSLGHSAVARLGKRVYEYVDADLFADDAHEVCVISDMTLYIGPGERVGILGANGAGKTTLLQSMARGVLPGNGTFKIGKTVQSALLSQQLQELDAIKDDMVRVVLGRYHTHYEIDGKMLSPQAMLERLGFDREALNAFVRDLSGGQKRRLQLLLILLEKPNVLILDEPGNDLDTDMLTVLESVLDSWPGTLIVVSHDRHLIERVTDTQYAIINKHLVHVPGGVDEYLDEVTREATRGAGASRVSASRRSQSGKTSPDERRMSSSGSLDSNAVTGVIQKSSQKNTYELRKQSQSTERKLNTQQNKLTELKDELAHANPYDFEELARIQGLIDETSAQIAELEDTWLRIMSELES